MAARATTTPEKIKVQAPKGEQTDQSVKQSIPLEEQIRQRAHEIYLQRGGQDGSEMDDWLQAEAELLATQGKEV